MGTQVLQNCLLWALKGFARMCGPILRRCIFNRHPPPVGGIVRDVSYGTHPARRLDVYVPPGEPPYPVLVYVHGGGWVTGDKASYERICRVFASAGYLVCSVNYRLAPRYRCPAQLADVAAAMSWVRRSVGRWGGDSDEIYAAGDSAGAHLVSWFCVALDHPRLFVEAGINEMSREPGIKGVLLFYGVYRLRGTKRRCSIGAFLLRGFLGEGEFERRWSRLASPYDYIGPYFPPALICAGQRDPLCGESMAFERALLNERVTCRGVYPLRNENVGACHGFLNFPRNPCTVKTLDESLRFLAECRHLNARGDLGG